MPRDSQTDILDELKSNRLSELFVDFFGSLIPGITFVFAIFPAFIMPVTAPLFDIFPSDRFFPLFLGELSTTTGSIVLVIIPTFSSILVLSFVFGHLFYRQNPKRVDERSFKTIPQDDYSDGPVRSDGSTTPGPVEFPYRDLKAALESRGLTYLSQHVPWDKNDFHRRSKHFANALKIRIHIEDPRAYRLLARNEAHIRLSSSMWYVSKTIRIASLVGICVLSACIIFLLYSQSQIALSLVPILIFPVLCLTASQIMIISINRSFHYQRVREIYFILETAHWLQTRRQIKEMFEGLAPT